MNNQTFECPNHLKDEIGSIESLKLNNIQYFFGLNQYNALSPLFLTAEEIAQWATNYMKKSSGKVSYIEWLEEANECYEHPEPWNKGSADFNLDKIQQTLLQLTEISKGKKKQITQGFEYNYIWLLGTVTEWPELDNIKKLSSIELYCDIEDIDNYFDVLIDGVNKINEPIDGLIEKILYRNVNRDIAICAIDILEQLQPKLMFNWNKILPLKI